MPRKAANKKTRPGEYYLIYERDFEVIEGPETLDECQSTLNEQLNAGLTEVHDYVIARLSHRAVIADTIVETELVPVDA